MENEKIYKGFSYVCKDEKSEEQLKNYIDSLGKNPTELKNVSQENYDRWHCDYDFDGVLYLKLPDTIKKIGKCVFAQSHIKELVGDGVELVDELAFYNTQELDRVSLPACERLLSTDPETNEETDGSDAFNHSAVKFLDLRSVKKVGRYAFYDMPNITNLSLPSAEHLEPYAIYGNQNLAEINLDGLKNAGFAIISKNYNLKLVTLHSLKSKDRQAFYCNAFDDDIEFFMPDIVITTYPDSEPRIKFSDEILREARTQEEFEYQFTYKDFKFNFVEGLSDEELENAKRDVMKFVDFTMQSGGYNILTPKSHKEDESGFSELALVKDIYLPNKIKTIGNYAFAKCYNLNSIVGKGVDLVGDHAFYCDSALRYVDFENASLLLNDAFNGAGYDYASKENVASNKIAKIFMPNVVKVGCHAFWQTGFRVIEMPNADAVLPTAFEENGVLQRLEVKSINWPYTLSMNPQLVEVSETEPLKNKKHSFYGSPYVNDEPETEPGE